MEAAHEQGGSHLLDAWMERNRHKPSRTDPEGRRGQSMRIAFYGRTSAVEHQDWASSHGWQREAADDLIAGHGAMGRVL